MMNRVAVGVARRYMGLVAEQAIRLPTARLCGTFGNAHMRMWPARLQLGGFRAMSSGASKRVFYASPGKTVDPAPSPSMPSLGVYQQLQSMLKTQVTYYRIRNATPPIDFSPASFPNHAGQLYRFRDQGDDRDFMTALNKVDRSALRDMLTERMLSRFKSHLPDKKELTKAKKSGHLLSAPAFVTGACSIVQARAVQIAPPVDTVFVQVTCEISVLQPEKDLVRVVFERPLASPEGRWRICDLIR